MFAKTRENGSCPSTVTSREMVMSLGFQVTEFALPLARS